MLRAYRCVCVRACRWYLCACMCVLCTPCVYVCIRYSLAFSLSLSFSLAVKDFTVCTQENPKKTRKIPKYTYLAHACAHTHTRMFSNADKERIDRSFLFVCFFVLFFFFLSFSFVWGGGYFASEKGYGFFFDLRPRVVLTADMFATNSILCSTSPRADLKDGENLPFPKPPPGVVCLICGLDSKCWCQISI